MTLTGRAYRSLRLDVRSTNGTTVFVIFFSDKSTKICPALSRRIEALGLELRADLRNLQCRCEPAGQLRNRFVRRLGWRDDPVPDVDVNVLVAGLGNGRHLRQRRNSCLRCDR